MQQDWRRNFVLVLFILGFNVVLLFLAMNAAEAEELIEGRAALAYPGLELGVGAIGFVRCGPVFGIF